MYICLYYIYGCMYVYTICTYCYIMFPKGWYHGTPHPFTTLLAKHSVHVPDALPNP